MTGASPFPTLDAAIEVQDGLALEDLWDRFEVFEALHHTLAICNPLSETQLDEVLDRLDPRAGDSFLDLGCGYGDLMFRACARAHITAVGVDLSPWMIAGAHQRRLAQSRHGDVRLVVGDAQRFATETPADIAACIGAEWIWHDVNGTARALRALVRPGGRIALGGARLHFDADPDDVARRLGRIETVAQQRAQLEALNLRPIARVDATDSGWDDYLRATADAARRWATLHPGPRADQWLLDQADWQLARERDRGVIGWSVWVAEVC